MTTISSSTYFQHPRSHRIPNTFSYTFSPPKHAFGKATTQRYKTITASTIDELIVLFRNTSVSASRYKMVDKVSAKGTSYKTRFRNAEGVEGFHPLFIYDIDGYDITQLSIPNTTIFTTQNHTESAPAYRLIALVDIPDTIDANSYTQLRTAFAIFHKFKDVADSATDDIARHFAPSVVPNFPASAKKFKILQKSEYIHNIGDIPEEMLERAKSLLKSNKSIKNKPKLYHKIIPGTQRFYDSDSQEFVTAQQLNEKMLPGDKVNVHCIHPLDDKGVYKHSLPQEGQKYAYVAKNEDHAMIYFCNGEKCNNETHHITYPEIDFDEVDTAVYTTVMSTLIYIFKSIPHINLTHKEAFDIIPLVINIQALRTLVYHTHLDGKKQTVDIIDYSGKYIVQRTVNVEKQTKVLSRDIPTLFSRSIRAFIQMYIKENYPELAVETKKITETLNSIPSNIDILQEIIVTITSDSRKEVMITLPSIDLTQEDYKTIKYSNENGRRIRQITYNTFTTTQLSKPISPLYNEIIEDYKDMYDDKLEVLIHHTVATWFIPPQMRRKILLVMYACPGKGKSVMLGIFQELGLIPPTEIDLNEMFAEKSAIDPDQIANKLMIIQDESRYVSPKHKALTNGKVTVKAKYKMAAQAEIGCIVYLGANADQIISDVMDQQLKDRIIDLSIKSQRRGEESELVKAYPAIYLDCTKHYIYSTVNHYVELYRNMYHDHGLDYTRNEAYKFCNNTMANLYGVQGKMLPGDKMREIVSHYLNSWCGNRPGPDHYFYKYLAYPEDIDNNGFILIKDNSLVTAIRVILENEAPDIYKSLQYSVYDDKMIVEMLGLTRHKTTVNSNGIKRSINPYKFDAIIEYTPEQSEDIDHRAIQKLLESEDNIKYIKHVLDGISL